MSLSLLRAGTKAGLRAATLGLLLILVGCCGWGGDRRPYLERLRVDLGDAARAFSDGRLTGKQYLALSSDRAGKARLYDQDAAWKSAATGGDQDGDRVPDRLDACKDTPPLTATDRRGCPLAVAPDCPPNTPGCQGPDDDRRTRGLEDRVAFLLDPKCDASPVPQTPQPLEWGRDTRPLPEGHFNLAVTRVDNQTPGCALFYEIQVRIPEPGAQPPFRTYNVLFTAAEDLSPSNPRRVVFTLSQIPSQPPQRKALFFALHLHADPLQWRVRAVNGAGAVSSWSTPRMLGPSSSGVVP